MYEADVTAMASVPKRALALFLAFCLLFTGVPAIPAAADPEAGDQQAMDVAGNITGAKASYITRVGGKEATYPIGTDTEIPREAVALKIDVDFGEVHTKELRDQHARTLTYQLPDGLVNATVETPTVYDNSSTPPQPIGLVTARDGKVVLTYGKDGLPGDESSRTNGYFSFRCNVDKSKLSGNPATVYIGRIPIKLNFKQDDIAETGALKVEKSDPTYVSGADPANEGYLQYTVTVKTEGDKMPDVRVEDSITSGGAFSLGYLVTGTLAGGEGVSMEGTDPLADGAQVKLPDGNGTVSIAGSKPGKMTWTIGDMEANQTRSLTYRVKLDKNYVGLYNRNPLTNTATPYSKNYAHGSVSSSFTPHAGATVGKAAGEPVQNADNNTVTIPFTVTIQANEDNTWPIRNVKIADNLGRTYGADNTSTPDADRAAVCQYARFAKFRVEEKDPSTNATEQMTVPATSKLGDNPKIYYEPGNSYNPRFDMYVGDAAPGKSLVVHYDLVVDNRLFTMRNGSWDFKNDVTVRTDDNYGESVGGNARVGEGTSERSIGSQTWERKLDAAPLADPITQNPDNGQASVEIPKGAIPYQVAVNEDGKWDVSQATFSDELGPHLKYCGYVQVDYYQNGAGAGITSSSSNEEVVAALKGQNPTATVYCDVDGETRFSYTPQTSWGISGTGAYLLTYYVVPVGIENLTGFDAENSFSLGGDVTPPGVGAGTTTRSPIQMAPAGGLRVRHARFRAGGTNFSVNKTPWYYDSSTQEVYWVITGAGDRIPQGLALIDTPKQNCGAPELVGVYFGPASAGGQQFAKTYDTAQALSGSDFEPLNAGAYTWADNALSFNMDVSIPSGQSVYAIVKTPRALSGNVGNMQSYEVRNGLSLREAGEVDPRDIGEASMPTNGGGDLFKDLGQVISHNADGTWTVLSGGTGTQGKAAIAGADDLAPGVYLDWRVRLNYLGYLKGSYQVTDQLPSGTEPVYVRYFGVGGGLAGDDAPTMPELTGLGTGWRPVGLRDTAMDGSGAEKTANAYYDSATNRIRFDVENLMRSDGANMGSGSLEVQVLAKVSDVAACAGVPTTFENTVEMEDKAGNRVGRGTSAALVNADTVTKTTAGVGNMVIPFSITVNPRAEALAGGSPTLTVVDEMLDPLEFDVTSLQVTADGDDITDTTTIRDGGRTKAGDGKVLYIDIPNSKKVVIEYRAIPLVRQNEKFDINNTAYLMGYEGSADKAAIDNANVGVSAGSSTTGPGIIVATKRDRDNIRATLPGAEFQLQQVTWNADEGAWEADGSDPKTARSDADGKASFGGLEYNVPYCLTEIAPPTGYRVDPEPRYLVIARSTSNDRNNPSYPEDVQTYAENGAQVQYGGMQMAVNIYDSRDTGPGGPGDVNSDGPTEPGADTPGGTDAPGSGSENGGALDNAGSALPGADAGGSGGTREGGPGETPASADAGTSADPSAATSANATGTANIGRTGGAPGSRASGAASASIRQGSDGAAEGDVPAASGQGNANEDRAHVDGDGNGHSLPDTGDTPALPVAVLVIAAATALITRRRLRA